ncbi:MAG: hypothetical protein HY077_01185 [Elusimicrobia bacterium]|nr:hypothetical protein [Elusimicrobiota bacterium]
MFLGADRNTWLGALSGLATGVAVAVGGFFLLRDLTGAMGITLFILLPLAIGLSVGFVARPGARLWAILILALIVSSSILIFAKAEGLLCVLMALPLVLPGAWIGALLGNRVRKKYIDAGRGGALLRWLLLAAMPCLLMGAYRLETPYRRVARLQTVENVARFDAPIQEVWDRLKAVERIDASRPLFMLAGLPRPIYCELIAGKVGGRRVCHFNNGVIEEEITEWAPPVRMGMRITRATLPGRHWLKYVAADYALRQEGSRTVVSRTTSVSSRLYPAWYWSPLERWGIDTEHRYLFESVSRSLRPSRPDGY